MEALARARPCTLPELTALSKVPRFSKNKRKLYGQDIVMALQQVGPLEWVRIQGGPQFLA